MITCKDHPKEGDIQSFLNINKGRVKEEKPPV
jgi:hypothetical protein